MANFTIDQVTALTEAIALGAKSVKYADKTVEYRSLDEMRSLLRQMQIDLGLISDSTPSTRRVAEFNKGL